MRNTIMINADSNDKITIEGKTDGTVELNGNKVETVEELTNVVSLLIRTIISSAGGEVEWTDSK